MEYGGLTPFCVLSGLTDSEIDKIPSQASAKKQLCQATALHRPAGRERAAGTVVYRGEAKGCVGWHFSQDVEDENAFVLAQEWESQGDLDEHFQSETFEVLLGGANLLCDPPEIGVRLFSSVERAGPSEEAMGRLTLS